MKRTEDIDRNMAIAPLPENPRRIWRDAKEAPFRIHGLCDLDAPGGYRRLPKAIAEATNEGVAELAFNPSGGRVRFVTDSPFVAIRAELSNIYRADHMTLCGTSGFDLYIEGPGRPCVYRGTFRPPVDMADGYESELKLPEGGPWVVTVNMALYNRVERLLIGLEDGCRLERAPDYRRAVPVVYYGSSITQGGCASRPGNSYTAIISRMLDCDFINLGFSGSGRGETVIAEYMAGLRMSAFVCDYDHNAPDADHLWKTHERLYRIIRDRNPGLPILLVSRPDVLWNEADAEARRAAIRATYDHAVAAGDANIAFIDGATLLAGPMADSCTVDGCHPNDLGMLRMAQVIGAELGRWL